MTTAAPAAPTAPAAPAAPAPAAGGDPTKTPEGAPKTDPAKSQGAAAEAANRKKKYVVDGAEVEIDLSDEKAVDEHIQRGLGANKRFKEAAKWRQQGEMLIDLLRNKPMVLLEQAAKLSGGDLRKTVEDWLYENHVKVDQMTPEQKKAYELEQQNKKLIEEKETREQTAKREQFEKAKATYSQNFERDIIKALQDGSLPKTPRTVNRMAEYMLQAMKAGAKLSASDVAPLVAQDIQTELGQVLALMTPEILVKFIGDGNLKRIRQFELAQIKAQGGLPQNGNGDGQPPQPAAAGEPKKKMTWDEFQADLDKRIGK